MIDIDKIKNDYERLKSQSHANILPFDKIISLEKSKQELIDIYLSQIEKINSGFDITSKTGFYINDLIKYVKHIFGDLKTGKKDRKRKEDVQR